MITKVKEFEVGRRVLFLGRLYVVSAFIDLSLVQLKRVARVDGDEFSEIEVKVSFLRSRIHNKMYSDRLF